MKIIKNNSNLEIKEIKIIVCSPGLGKTYLSEMNNKFIDIDRLRSNFKYNRDKNYSIVEHEKSKGTKRTTLKTKEEVLKYSIDLIKNNIESNKISLIAPNEDLVKTIYKLNIPYAIVFCDKKINNIMMKRLYKRGNSKQFVEEMYGDEISEYYYNKDMEDNRPSYKIVFDIY